MAPSCTRCGAHRLCPVSFMYQVLAHVLDGNRGLQVTDYLLPVQLDEHVASFTSCPRCGFAQQTYQRTRSDSCAQPTTIPSCRRRRTGWVQGRPQLHAGGLSLTIHAPHRCALLINPHTGNAMKCAVIDMITCSDQSAHRARARNADKRNTGTALVDDGRRGEMSCCFFLFSEKCEKKTQINAKKLPFPHNVCFGRSDRWASASALACPFGHLRPCLKFRVSGLGGLGFGV